MTMLPLILLLLLSLPSIVHSSPLCTIMCKSKKEHVIGYDAVSNGVVLTKKYLLTTQYPAALFPVSTLCILLFSKDFEGLDAKLIEKYCLLLKQLIPFSDSSPLNLALAETYGDFDFFFGSYIVSILPLSVTYEPIDCALLYKHPLANRLNRFRAYGHHMGAKIYSIRKRDKAIFMRMRTDHEHKVRFCPRSNGLPLFCKSGVVALLNFIDRQYCQGVHVYDCIEYCAWATKDNDTFEMTFVDIQTEEVHKFLKAHDVIVNW